MEPLVAAPCSSEVGTGWVTTKMAIVMVGLPATGKTYTARNLCRYLRWLGLRTRSFSVANYRNKLLGERLGADFFDPSRPENLEKRTEVANRTLDDLILWLESSPKDVIGGIGGGSGCQVALLDASNTRSDRRKYIYDRLKNANIRVVFLECLANEWDDELITQNLHDRRMSCPESDFAHYDDLFELMEYKRRIAFYKPHYETVGAAEWESSVAFIKFIKDGKKIEVNQLSGYLPSRILYYLMNLHHVPRRIYFLTLPGKTMPLKEYVEPVKDLLDGGIAGYKPQYVLWTETSVLGAVLEDVFPNLLTKPQLRGRDCGVTEGMSQVEIAEKYPEDYARYLNDPYTFRFARAESYHDVAVRLENVMMELERERKDVLIIADNSVLQCLYAYFCEIANKEIPAIEMSPGTLFELKVKAFGVHERKISLPSKSNVNLEIGPERFISLSENVMI